MGTNKAIDVNRVKETFRIRNGNLERINNHFPYKRWTVVNRKATKGDLGYCRVAFNGTRIRYHRIIWILCNGQDITREQEIGHINGNIADNRIENLRAVTHRVNTQNKKSNREGKLTGASAYKQSNRYQAVLWIKTKYVKIGNFETAIDSHRAYEIACNNIYRYVDNTSFRALVKKELSKEKKRYDKELKELKEGKRFIQIVR